MTRMFCATLVVGLCVAANVSAQTSASPAFYPLKEGATWTYDVLNSQIEMKVVGKENVGDQECFKIATLVNGTEVATEHVAVKEDGFYRYQVSGIKPENPIQFLKFGQPGEKWSVDSKVANQEIKGQFVLSEAQDLKIGEKTYPVALVATGKDMNIAGQSTDVTYWFVENVGIVKLQFSLDGQDITLTLKPSSDPAPTPEG